MAPRDLIRAMAGPPPAVADPTMLHPAAQKAAAVYSDALNENERLREENRQLITELEIAKRDNISLRRQLGVERRTCEHYRSYAVEVRTHLGTIMQVTQAAHEKGVAFMTATAVPDPPAENDLERQIATAATENVQKGESP